MFLPRTSGILLHPTSLPGKYGIGDLGANAYRFVNYLQETSQSWWQVLPLGPTSYGDSPYQALSAFAGNPNLVSLDKLRESGWLTETDLANVPDFPRHKIDYGWVIDYHNKMLALAYERFAASDNTTQKETFKSWCESNANWLDDFAIFYALKNENDGKPWVEWANADEALYKPEAIAAAKTRLSGEVEGVKFRQWVFYTQWTALKAYANERGISLIGDIPIFVAHDSSDVWANRRHYYLDDKGNPEIVAGVPPDYFSATGQRWGNPLYKWDVLKDEDYGWWVDRFSQQKELVDLVRIDHFRGFEDYWAIPATEPTAVKGAWRKGPNVHFFEVLRQKLGELPIIAEDLGMITAAVEKLRDDLNLPGMKILQFAWSDAENEFLPHNYVNNNCVVYTGTHDNNTTLGWWHGDASDGEKAYMQAYLDRNIGDEPHWQLMRLGMMSSAQLFVAPMQDVLGFGADTRMNTPSVESGNWGWRFTEEWFDYEPSKSRYKHLTHVYGRQPTKQGKTRG